MSKLNPYDSPQTPPSLKPRLHGNAPALGKVLAVLLGLFIASLCVGMAVLVYALLNISWL